MVLAITKRYDSWSHFHAFTIEIIMYLFSIFPDLCMKILFLADQNHHFMTTENHINLEEICYQTQNMHSSSYIQSCKWLNNKIKWPNLSVYLAITDKYCMPRRKYLTQQWPARLLLLLCVCRLRTLCPSSMCHPCASFLLSMLTVLSPLISQPLYEIGIILSLSRWT